VETAPDVVGWRVVQLFYDVNSGRYLHLPLERGEIDTSRTSVTPGATLLPMGIGQSNTFSILVGRDRDYTGSPRSESEEYI
jgi:hypothetical protein